MKRSTRRVLVGIGLYVVGAIALANVIGAVRGDTPGYGQGGVGSFLLVLLTLGLLGYGIYHFRFRPRLEAGQTDAWGLRLRHSRDDRFGLRDLPFALFGRLMSPWTIGNVLWGRWEGLDVTVFDVWSAGRQFSVAGQDAPGREYRCVMIGFPPSWPSIVVEQERLTTRLTDSVAMADIAFESEGFNRRFEVRCSDARFAHTLLDAQMIAWLLDLEREWGFEAMGGRLLGYTPMEGLDGPEVPLSTIRSFLEHVPDVTYSLFPVGEASEPAPPPAR